MDVLPKRLIRFYGNNEFALECISFREIAIIHTRKINDPFDPNWTLPPTDFDWEFGKFIKNFNRLPEFDESIAKNQFDTAKRKALGKLENFKKRSYLFCMFSIEERQRFPDSMYMWSHYANGHRGVAIEFDVEIMSAFLEKHAFVYENGTEIKYDPIYQVTYLESDLDYEKYKVSSNDYYDFLRKNSSVFDDKMTGYMNLKSKEYRPEKEWRFLQTPQVANTDVKRLSDLPPDAITNLYLGYNIDNSYAHRMVEELKRNFPTAKVFKAKKLNDKLDLEFINLN